ncbi:MAG TPA: hypothetical protein VLF67_02720 [Candidatus Saccharimonas sp.]|nr:hypothetical protein [Candidatus Saccharimonas sp.]
MANIDTAHWRRYLDKLFAKRSIETDTIDDLAFDVYLLLRDLAQRNDSDPDDKWTKRFDRFCITWNASTKWFEPIAQAFPVPSEQDAAAQELRKAALDWFASGAPVAALSDDGQSVRCAA